MIQISIKSDSCDGKDKHEYTFKTDKLEIVQKVVDILAAEAGIKVDLGQARRKGDGGG